MSQPLTPEEAAAEGLPPLKALTPEEAAAEGLPPPPPTSSVAGAAWRKFAHGVVPFDAQIVGAGNALQKKLQGSDAPIGDLYAQERDARRQQLAADQEQHPVVSDVANLAGGMAGPARLLPGSTLAKAAKSGAVIGGVNALADNTDPLVGAAIGFGAGSLGYGVGKLAAPLADYLKGIARNRAISAAGPTAGEVRNTLGRGEADKLGDWLLQNKGVRFGDTAENVAARVGKINSVNEAAKDAAIDALDNSGKFVNTDTLSDEIRNAGLSQDSPFTRDITKRFEQAALNVEKTGGYSSFGDVDRLRQAAQSRVNYAKLNPTTGQQGDSEIASIARRFARDSAAGPEGQAYRDALDNLHMGYTASGMAEGAAGRATARNMMPPSSKALGAIGIGASLATGNPVPAVAGLALGAANKFISSRAASSTAVVANTASQKLAQVAQTAPQMLGRFAPVLANALRAGPAEYNAKVFTLAQTDPEFQALQKKIGGE